MAVVARAPHSPPSDPPPTVSEVLLTAQSLLLLIVAAWAGGGRLPGAPLLLATISLGALPLLALRRKEGLPVRWLALLPAVLWLGLVGVALLNPSHAQATDGTWRPRPDWISWLPTTADQARTRAEMLPWLAALVQGGALVAATLPRRATRVLWGGLALNGFLLAVTGAFFHFLHADLMLGTLPVPDTTYFFATFYYKNHWAAYGALAALAGLTLALDGWRRAIAGERRGWGPVVLFGGTALLTLCTLPLPGSRAGLLLAGALVAGFATAAIHACRKPAAPPTNGPLVAGILLFAVLVAGAGFYAERSSVDLERTRAQLRQHAAGGVLDLRFELMHDTWKMARARPWFGWGVGTYEIVFPVFQGKYLRGPDGRPAARFEFAHNDWLQIFAEGGLAGALVLLGAAVALGRRAARRAGTTGRWALAGLALVAAYAWFDFPFHNPAVLLLWTGLAATITARRLIAVE